MVTSIEARHPKATPMTRATLLVLAALSLAATPVVVNATASTPGQTQAKAAEPAPAVQAPAPDCARKVRVVYAGLNEGKTVCQAR